MGSVYKALMRAAEEREALKKKAAPITAEDAAALKDASVMEEEMLVLLESIESLLFRKRRKIIRFVGSQEGERASTVARAYAKTAATVIGLSVLLVEPAFCDSSLARALTGELEDGPLGSTGDPDRLGGMFHQVGETKVFVSPSANSALCSTEALDSQSTQLLWALLRERFDLIVIDSGPLSESTGLPANVAGADGIVLVFESEMPELAASCSKEDIGLASILDVIAQGELSPVEVVTCLGAPLLLLTPAEQPPNG